MINVGTLRASAFALVAVFAAGNAYAQDANAVAQRLKDVVAEQGGGVLGWSAVTGGGSNIVIEKATLTIPGKAALINIGNVTLDDVAEANGGYTVGAITFQAFDVKESNLNITGSAAVLNKVRIPAAGQTNFLDQALLYESGKLDHVEVKQGDKVVASVDNTHFEMPAPVDGKLSFTGAADKFSADLTAIPDPQTQAIISALGYQQISGKLQMGGSWNLNDGQMQITKYEIAVDNAAKINFTFDIGGYTPELLKAMQDITKKAEAPNADESARNVAMLGLMQQVLFNGASIRIDDDSLTNKALDFVAKQQGADASQLKEQTKTIIPFLLASSPIKDEALKKQISDAVAAYIDNPKSLTITAKPAQPQPFSAIAMQGQADPASLTTTLGVSVSAND